MTRAAPTTRAKTEKAIHLTMTKTVTCHSNVTMTKKLTPQRLKKRIGLITLRGAPKKLWKRWKNEKIRCWDVTQRKMKWRLAMRIATSLNERWLIKAAEWNPELSSIYRTNRSIGRPRKRWEDDINEFRKQKEEETENQTESRNQINKNWINTAKDRGRWTLLEENYTTNSKGRHENNTRTRRNSNNIPARYGNGVKLSDEELADIT